MTIEVPGAYAAIDYSMTCPCCCLFRLSYPFKFENCSFHFLSEKPFRQTVTVSSSQIPKVFESAEARWDLLSSKTFEFVDGCDRVAIEQYAFGKRSNNNSQMGEHTGLLKHKLWKRKTPIELLNISHVKKFSGAAGGGRAKKDQIYEQFLKDEPQAAAFLAQNFGLKVVVKKRNGKDVPMVESPGSDIVDAYYLGKYFYYLLQGDPRVVTAQAVGRTDIYRKRKSASK